MVALPETGLEGALELAERFAPGSSPSRSRGSGGAGAVSVTASVGAASMHGSADGAEALIAAADAALYEAKRAGKNRVAGAGGAAKRPQTAPERCTGADGRPPVAAGSRHFGPAGVQESVPASPTAGQ